MAAARIHTDIGIIEFAFDSPALLGDILNLGKHPVDMPCGKQGVCGKCRVKAEGKLKEPDISEEEALTHEELLCGYRLACRAVAVGDVDIYIGSYKKEEILTDFKLPKDLNHTGEGLGLAVDIGTTTLAGYIYDMESGRLVDVSSMPNPQRQYGADVTNRLKSSLEGKKREISECIKSAISQLAGKYRTMINKAVITGNTAMLYLLTEEDVSSIAYAPFEPTTRMGIELSGDKVGLAGNTRVWLPHCVSAYVGADITCAMIYAATKSEHNSKPVLLADIGTNGEMALFTGDRILTCSTAAGPAFEGAGILCGTTAREGAINRVDVIDGRIEYSVIGDGAPFGICGSGLIDAVAALVKLGAVDETGRMYPTGHPLEDRMTEFEGSVAYRFYESGVLITQEDIRNVQLAKAAICGGILTLLDEAGLTCEDINHMQIAGGFGNCLRPDSAAAIGLIPQKLADKVSTLGNGAGAGGAMMLLDESLQEAGRRLSEECETVELSTSQVFADHYISSMALERCE